MTAATSVTPAASAAAAATVAAGSAAAERPRAHRIASPDEALEVAREQAAAIAAGAAERDRERRLPYAELDALSASGLLAITVPAAFGGADVPARTLAQVVRLLSAADPNVAQIPQSHFVYINVLKQQGTASQQQRIFGDVLDGKRLGNAQSERGTKTVQEIRTRLRRADDGDGFVLDGVKHYATGALFADWIPVLAKGGDDELYVAYVEAGTEGLEVIDDWDGLGQRTTASGTVRLDGVRVPAELVVPHHLTFKGPTLHGAQAQLIHTAIDVGIADAALADATAFVRTRARPWFEAGVERAADDPLLIQRVGELAVTLRAAGALLDVAADAVDRALADPTDATTADASIAVATAKVAADRAAIELTNALFEVSGASSALTSLALDRHWRNARTHTLHDPVRWKLQHIGRYTIDGTAPPRHAAI